MKGSKAKGPGKSRSFDMFPDQQYEEEPCSLLCFVVGVIAMFLVVGAIATVIVLGVDERYTVTSLTSTRHAKPLTPEVMEAITDPSAMYVQVLENTNTDPNAELDLLVLVRSLPANSSSRDAIRKTWMVKSWPKVEILFVIPALGSSPSVLEAVKQESRSHQDMVVFMSNPVMPESEALMTELVWSMRARKFAFLMKTRDSMYVRIDALMKDVIQDLQKSSSNAYLGYFEGRRSPKDKVGHMLPEPDWHLCDKFIRYAHSGGYILSRKLVDRLHTQVAVLYPYNNEDVAVGTWLSPYDDIAWSHNIKFDTDLGRSRGCRDDMLVFPCADMVKQHDRLTESKKVCLSEHEDVETYQYNFNTFPAKCCSPVKFDEVKS